MSIAQSINVCSKPSKSSSAKTTKPKWYVHGLAIRLTFLCIRIEPCDVYLCGIAGILIFLCSLMFHQFHTISIQFAIHFVLGQPLLPKYRKSSLRFQLRSSQSKGNSKSLRHADSHLKHRLSQLNSHSIIACRSKYNSLMKSAILLAAKSTIAICNLIDSAIWRAVNIQFVDGHRNPLLLRKVGNLAENVGRNLSLLPSLDWFTWDNSVANANFMLNANNHQMLPVLAVATAFSTIYGLTCIHRDSCKLRFGRIEKCAKYLASSK